MGKHLKYETPEEMETKVEEYFNNCPDKKPFFITSYSKKGRKERVKIELPYPTVSGLCLYMGFASRQSFYDYAERGDYSYIIKKAVLYLERTHEMRLGENPVGAIFVLKNMGWRDSPVIDQSQNTYTLHIETKEGKFAKRFENSFTSEPS